MSKSKVIEDIANARHLTWSMESHPSEMESEEKRKDILKETTCSWEDASYWLTPLKPNKIGLPVTILVDEGASVRNDNGPICIYFRNSYDESNNDFLPITVSSAPKVVFGCDSLHIYRSDLRKILLFVARNHKRLLDVAYDRLGVDEFVGSLRMMNEEKVLLREMSRLHSKSTGLPFDIWIGINKKKHFLGVKFPPKQDVFNSDEFAEYVIGDGTIRSKVNVEAWRENLVKSFVKANKESLIELGKDFSKFDAVKETLTKIDDKGEPINVEPEYMSCSKNPVNGFIRVRNSDGKYNFIREGDESIVSEIWFDDARDFQKYENFTAAFVIVDNSPKWLYPDGSLRECY